MKASTQFSRLLAGVQHRGALMDDVGHAANRVLPGLPYPRLFAELVEGHTFVAFDVGRVRVYGNARGEEDSLEDLLADRILTDTLCGAGFLPFGRPATGHYDRVCFDMRGREHAVDAPVVLMDHEAILSFNRIPRPEHLADGIMELLDTDGVKAEPGAAPNSRPPSQLRASQEVQSPDSQRTTSSGGCG